MVVRKTPNIKEPLCYNLQKLTDNICLKDYLFSECFTNENRAFPKFPFS